MVTDPGWKMECAWCGDTPVLMRHHRLACVKHACEVDVGRPLRLPSPFLCLVLVFGTCLAVGVAILYGVLVRHTGWVLWLLLLDPLVAWLVLRDWWVVARVRTEARQRGPLRRP